MPGSNARAMEKARTLPADVIVFDLEDAVAPDAKDGRASKRPPPWAPEGTAPARS